MGVLGRTIRLIGVITASVCAGWILFATTVHEDPEDGYALGPARVGPVVRKLGGQRRGPMRSPAPVIKPAGSE